MAQDARPDATGYVALEREWRQGDVVDIGLPMPLRTEALPGNPGTVAFFCGPILLAGDLGSAGMPEHGAYARDQKEFEKWADPAPPVLTGDPAGLLSSLVPVDGQPLTYRVQGVTLAPPKLRWRRRPRKPITRAATLLSSIWRTGSTL